MIALIDALLPPTLARSARRLSTVMLVLGLMVLFMFPAAARAGTEVPIDRWLTGGLLVLTGVLLRVLPNRALPLLLLHAAAQAGVGARWAAVATAVMLLYALASAWRGRAQGSGAESGRGSGARGDDDDHDNEPRLHAADVVSENVEAVVMALLIALAVREFLYEAFLIPTASMKPTILGKSPAEDRKHGDRLLATKVPMLLGDPPRWSIVVFKYPLYRQVNYIKRLVGLPGEHVEIRGGDIYVNGDVVAKPEEIQNQLWFAEFPFSGESSVRGSWKPVDAAAEWSLDATSATVGLPEGGESRLRYDQTLDRNDTDLRVGAEVSFGEVPDVSDGVVLLRVDAGGRLVDLEVGPMVARLRVPGAEWADLDGVVLGEPGGRVDLGVADRVARVWIDGRLVARVPHEDVTESRAADSPRVSIGVRGASATFTDLRVEHDLQYSQSASWDIPDDGFIMLGDNTRSSKDSREWDVIELTAADGTVYHAEESVKLEDNSIVSFHKKGDDYVFLDVDGIARRVPVAGSTKRTGILAPFVRRRDLVGRAFVTFFPFPFGDFRLRFLP